MNIRKRLQVSNLLMIVVPAAVGLVVGIVLIAGAWLLVTGSGLGRSDVEEFSYEATAVAELVGKLAGDGANSAVSNLAGSDALEKILAANGLSLSVEKDGATLYEMGAPDVNEAQLRASVESLDAPVSVSAGNVALAKRAAGGGLTVYVSGNVLYGSKHATKAVLAVAGVALAVALIVAVVLASRFLASFVLRHVTDPLDELVAGVCRVSAGDLAFRLPEERDDEFAEAFRDFNQMAARLEASAEHERQLGEQRRDLVVGLSHDLKSPLTSIQAYAEGLIDGIAATDAARERYLRTIVDKCAQMRTQLKKISLVYRLDAELEPSELQVIDIRAFVDGWAADACEASEMEGVRLTVPPAAADEPPCEALVDTDLLARVLDNLVDNASKYARAGREMCQARVRVERGDEGAVRLTFEDDGPGVAEGELPRLFDLFYRCDTARANPTEGSGVGLAVVARAAQAMGGSVRAERSRELGGLAVVLELPAAPADATPVSNDNQANLPAAGPGEE